MQLEQLEDVSALGGEPTRNRDLRSRGKETVAKLLRSGHEVVEERGHDEARVDDIVARAGLSHGTFYLYFRDREDLLNSLIRLVARELQPLGASFEQAPTVASLTTWIRDAIAEFDRHAEVLRAARALGSDEAVADLLEPLAAWIARADGEGDSELAASLLLWHIERASVRDDIVDAEGLATAILRSAGASV